jgi:flagellar motor switch protein FliN/FliY
MTAQEETLEQTAIWLVEEWGRCFAAIVESMSDARPTTACDRIRTPWVPGDGALNFKQEFSLGPEYSVLIAIPAWLWRETGLLVLRGAGIDEVGEDDARSTFLEILNQTFSSLATSIGARLKQETTCGSRSDEVIATDEPTGFAVTVRFPDTEGAGPVIISPAPELIELLRSGGKAAPAQEKRNPIAPEKPHDPPPSSVSKTFDLLLGVNLPISVSFGKTTLMVKEVLKLTTGSIVELNRTVSEPVDIIVNNCIIARGEVVVVGGNYGVRVREIVSREERYQTGIRTSGLETN